MAQSLYIHIPYCVSNCAYCDFFSVPCAPAAVPDDYVSALCSEIALRAQAALVTRWKSVYIGGGTPSLLTGAQIQKIMDCVRDCTDDKDLRSTEVTLEVNPDDVTTSKNPADAVRPPVCRRRCRLFIMTGKAYFPQT